MWTYKQSTGELSHGGVFVVNGYSGHDTCRNDATKESVPNHGPIPRGLYTIGEPRNTEAHGPVVLPLQPDPANEMYGRSGFLIHGDSVRAPGTASQGCIILPRTVRIAIAQSGDSCLEVVA